MSPAGEFEGLFSARLELAMRLAARWHQGQNRRGGGIPYVQHVFAVAMILERAGFPEDAVIAGLLHDAIEDTPATIEEVRHHFGPEVADIVQHCSEVKVDPQGKVRPWIDRKRDHLAALASAPRLARAVILADKLHNLRSIAFDLRAGLPVWDMFHAPRDQVLWYYRASIKACEIGDPDLARLAEACRIALAEVEHSREPI
jgi:hypothetical protein